MPPDDVAGPLPPDLRRPLDESVPPADRTTGSTAPLPQLRPAVPGGPGHPASGVRLPAEPRRHRRRAGMLVRAATAPGRALRRASRAGAAWSRGPAGRLVVPGIMVVALIGGSGVAGTVLVPAVAATGATATASPTPAPTPAPQPPALPGAITDPALAPQPGVTVGPAFAPEPTPGARADALRGWAEQMSRRTGVPAVALQAYGYAELVSAQTNPGCQLSWTTLAAIGRVESGHGQAGGATLLADGRALPPIIGAPLDGQGDRMLIRDTDRGELDGDPVYDRAVGPMQFIPQTWRQEAVDATGNGVADINNIHDAALAAANYLCRGRRDLTVAADWWAAILSYNNVQAYANEVYAAANEYGRLSRA